MPVYEYKCTVCQERFEVEQSIRDAALTSLPGCEHGDHQLKKVFSPVGISFRGGGFYRNEARTASKVSASSDSSSGSDSAGKSGDGAGKSDSASTSKDSGSKATATATTTSD
jgi:putative FmdB family regulatory protein